MRITTNNIDFELPADFACELTRNNVLLTDAGEQTAPITLPGTPHNLRLVANSDRIDNYYKPLTDLDVVVSDGLFNRPCNLGIHTANEVDGISCTIYLGTGDFYSRAGEKKMASLAWPIYKSPTFNTQTLAQRVQYLIDILKSQYGTYNHNEIFRFAPVATSQEFTFRFTKYLSGAITSIVTDVTGVFILNGFERYQYQLDFEGTGTDSLTHFEGEYLQKQKVGENYIDINKGYGMTPFLKIRYVVEFVFSSFGFSFDSRGINELIHEYDDDIVILNNVADAIYAGILNFSQLVPNTTIKAFIQEVEKLLGGKFIFDEISKVVYFYEYQYALGTAIPDIDISEYVCNKPKLSSTEFTLVKVIDNNDAKSENDESEIPTETLGFDFAKEVAISAGYNSTGFENDMLQVDLNMITIDGIVHANTDIVVNNVVTDGKDTTSGTIRFANIKALSETAVTNSGLSGLYLDYYRSYRLFEGISTSSLLAVTPFYTAYKAFRLNSNIPLEAEMDIPAPILEKLNLQMPKILNGQKVMIESIAQTLGKKGTQKVKMRTLRQYYSIPVYDYTPTLQNYVNVLKPATYTYTPTFTDYKNTLINS